MPANALIIFLKYPEPGRVKTRLATSIGNQDAARVARRLAERTLTGACLNENSNHSTFIFFDPPDREAEMRDWLVPLAPRCALRPQNGDSLGDRMNNAFTHVLNQPEVQRAVIIGTDCPGLGASHIQRAFQALDQHPVVIGPAADGGYYLLGLKEPLPFIFENIPWSTNLVLAQTLEALDQKMLSRHLLPELRDIDTIEELNSLWPEWKKEIR